MSLHRSPIGAVRAWPLALLTSAVAVSPVAGSVQVPGRFAGTGIVVGLEYALLDSLRQVTGMADALRETGVPGMKHHVEAVNWGSMQKDPGAPVDFSKVDLFVREYQARGFTELTVSLKGHSPWGSKDVRRFAATNGSPMPVYGALYQQWIAAVVERYDGDGVQDMPELRWPVRYFEIGSEFSSEQPEPVGEYLEMLEWAYRAAHAASDQVLIAHAAFLITPVDMDVGDPSDYDKVWRTTRRRDERHGLADLRAILDRPDLFDVLNLHNLGSPYEIEHLVRWLAYETGRRGYVKPVIISDTTPTSYAAWGPASICRGARLSLMVPPATEADRCRLAAYFTKLVNRDRATLAWTRAFVAADHVQRVVIAADQGVRLINLGFTTDLPFLTSPLHRAGAGISAWGGALRMNLFTGRVLERYPSFYAVKQLMWHLTGYRGIERIQMPDAQARVYRIEGVRGPFWVAWRDPGGVLLPASREPALAVELMTGGEQAVVESVITAPGQTQATTRVVPTPAGRLTVSLTHVPVYIVPG